MYQRVSDAQHRSRLANELMVFHMKVIYGSLALRAANVLLQQHQQSHFLSYDLCKSKIF